MRFWNTAPNHLRTNMFKQQSRLTGTWVRHPERCWEVGEDVSDLPCTAQGSWIGPLAYDRISKRKRWLQNCIPVELHWYCWGAWTKSGRVFEFLNKLGLRALAFGMIESVEMFYVSMYHHQVVWTHEVLQRICLNTSTLEPHHPQQVNLLA